MPAGRPASFDTSETSAILEAHDQGCSFDSIAHQFARPKSVIFRLVRRLKAAQAARRPIQLELIFPIDSYRGDRR
jgi:hypothetical protein